MTSPPPHFSPALIRAGFTTMLKSTTFTSDMMSHAIAGSEHHGHDLLNDDHHDDDFDLFAPLTEAEVLINDQRKEAMNIMKTQALESGARLTVESRRQHYLLTRGTTGPLVEVIPNVWTADECAIIRKALSLTVTKRGGVETDRHVSFPTNDVPVDEIDATISNDLPEEYAKLVSNDLTGSSTTMQSTSTATKKAWIQDSVIRRVLNVVEPKLGFEKGDLVLIDLFVVVYDADDQTGKGRTSLEAHTDGCLISFNISLSDVSEYEGGGTCFFDDVEGSVTKSGGGMGDADGAGAGMQAGKNSKVPSRIMRVDQGDCILHDSKILHGGQVVTKGTRLVCVGFVDTLRTGKLINGELIGKYAGR
ncbi:hypothetical protein HDU76_013662, partial [Blyttiomyces sp. JEL0837]